MRLIKDIILILLIASCISFKTFAADTTHTPLRIAILIPLNLDSAFNGTTYDISNTKISQYFLSGLEFYNGVKMAIDSLQKENANIEVWIYDTHKQGVSTQQLTEQMQPLNFSMLLAVFSSTAEQKIISDFSATNSIPVISATYPTDAYLEHNPFFIMLNPTWKTHVEAIYDYLSKNYRNQKIIYLTKNGTLENKIADEFKLLNTNHNLIFSNIILNDNFSDEDVLKHLDSTKQNILLCGSLNENFGRAIIKTLNANGDMYHTTITGMPTWNGMGGTTGSSSDKIQIIMSTPFDYEQASDLLNDVSNEYRAVYYAKPGDMMFKGYGMMYHFTKLLLYHPDDFINNVSDTSYKIFNDYNIEPIRLSSSSFVPDYLENKKIYFIKTVDGEIQSVQ